MEIQQPSYVCKKCQSEFTSQEELTTHISTHVAESEDPRCSLCGESCPSLTILKRHFRAVHPTAENPADAIQARLIQRMEMRAIAAKAKTIKASFLQLGVPDRDIEIDKNSAQNKPGNAVLDLDLDMSVVDDDSRMASNSDLESGAKPNANSNATTGFQTSNKKRKPSSSYNYPPLPCYRCAKTFATHNDRAKHVKICNKFLQGRSTSSTKKTGPMGPVIKKSWVDYDIDEDDLQYAPINPKNGELGIGIAAPTNGGFGPCRKCGQPFKDKMSRAFHARYCKRFRLYRCNSLTCREEFTIRAEFVRHIRRHINQRLHQCRICSARFPHRKDANKHMKNVHNFQPKCRAHPCDLCSESFLLEYELEYHLNMDHDSLTIAEVFQSEEEDELVEVEFRRATTRARESQEFTTVVTVDDATFQKLLLPNVIKTLKSKSEPAVQIQNPEEEEEEEEEELLDPSQFLEQSMETESDLISCSLCSQKCLSDEGLETHMRITHYPKPIPQKLSPRKRAQAYIAAKQREFLVPPSAIKGATPLTPLERYMNRKLLGKFQLDSGPPVQAVKIGPLTASRIFFDKRNGNGNGGGSGPVTEKEKARTPPADEQYMKEDGDFVVESYVEIETEQ